MQWKARYGSEEEIWENPSTSTDLLNVSRLTDFELVEDGVVRHSFHLTPGTGFKYIRRTRFPLFGPVDPETSHLVALTRDGSGTVTIVTNEHTLTTTDLSVLN